MKRLKFVIFTLLLLGLAACTSGGGGGGSGSQSATDWDSMKWDQDNWS
jgi:hypothetical protein